MKNRIRFLGIFFLLSLSAHAGGLADGLYARFDTSMGSFTARLDYVNAPLAVANFVGLVEGSQAWLDIESGRPRTNNFYQGLIFHRVIDDLLIQTGSPQGSGEDGPGYQFVDEVNNGLTHSTTGMLSMANSGLNSNGSQFFITLRATPQFDGDHTVFGQVIAGLNVVTNIGAVATDGAPPSGNDRPLIDVMLQDVEILRIGAAALAFDPSVQGLPVVDTVEIKSLIPAPGETTLEFLPVLASAYHVSVSSNLVDFARVEGPFFLDPPTQDTLSVSTPSNAPPVQIFALSQVDYRRDLFTPAAVTNRTLELTFTGSNAGLILTIVFDDQGTGTYDFFDGNSHELGSVISYAFEREALRFRLLNMEFDGFFPMDLNFATDSPAANRWEGQLHLPVGPPSNVEGTYRFLP